MRFRSVGIRNIWAQPHGHLSSAHTQLVCNHCVITQFSTGDNHSRARSEHILCLDSENSRRVGEIGGVLPWFLHHWRVRLRYANHLLLHLMRMWVQNLLKMQKSFIRWRISPLMHVWQHTHTHTHFFRLALSPYSSVVSLLKYSSYRSVSLEGFWNPCWSTHICELGTKPQLG